MKVIVKLRPEIAAQNRLIATFADDMKHMGGSLIGVDKDIARVTIPDNLMSSLKTLPGVLEVLGVDLSTKDGKTNVSEATKKQSVPKARFNFKTLGVGGGLLALGFFLYWLGTRNGKQKTTS